MDRYLNYLVNLHNIWVMAATVFYMIQGALGRIIPERESIHG